MLQHTVNTTFLHSVSIHPELPQGDLEGLDTLDHTLEGLDTLDHTLEGLDTIENTLEGLDTLDHTLEGLDTLDHTLFKLLAVHKLNTNECAARRAELLEFVKLHRLALLQNS